MIKFELPLEKAKEILLEHLNMPHTEWGNYQIYIDTVYENLDEEIEYQVIVIEDNIMGEVM